MGKQEDKKEDREIFRLVVEQQSNVGLKLKEYQDGRVYSNGDINSIYVKIIEVDAALEKLEPALGNDQKFYEARQKQERYISEFNVLNNHSK
jgi:hypothetical protein